MKQITIYLLIALIFLTGCANEKKFVRFYQKCTSDSSNIKKQEIPAVYCASWYPTKPITKTTTVYKSGKEKIVPGKTRYITLDCDSAVKAANGKPAKKVVVKVPVYLTRDTVFLHDSSTIIGGPQMRLLELKNNECADNLTKQKVETQKQKDETDKFKGEKRKWEGRALWTWGILLLLLIGTLIMKYLKSKIP